MDAEKQSNTQTHAVDTHMHTHTSRCMQEKLVPASSLHQICYTAKHLLLVWHEMINAMLFNLIFLTLSDLRLH